MRITRVIAIPLIGVLVILGACASPAAVTPAAPAPAATMPATPEHAATMPATPVAAAPTPATPTPVATAPIVTAPVPGKTAFVASELRMDPETIVEGDNVTISVKVTNTGKERGTYTVVLKLNGDTVKTQDVTLDGGSSGKVALTVVPEAAGEYKVTIEQLTAKLDVLVCPV